MEEQQQPETKFDISKIDIGELKELIKQPEIQQWIIDNSEEVRQQIEDSGYGTLVYAFLRFKYPAVYEALSLEPQEPQERSTTRERDYKPVPHSEIEFQAVELSNEGYSISEIADMLSEKFDQDIYSMHIGAILKRHREKQPQQPQDNGLHLISRSLKWVAKNVF